MRHNPSTVVVLAGQANAGLLAAVGRPANVTLVRPEVPAGPAGADGSTGDEIEVAASALRRAARISSPYVLVAADPLAAVAAQWQAMWELTQAPRGTEAFELRAGEALAAWRANQFELPDYYLVLAREQRPGGPPPGARSSLPTSTWGRFARCGRTVFLWSWPAEPAEQAAGVVTALGSLRHGRWWPPLPDVIDAARRFYPGSISPSPDAGAVPLLRLPDSLFPGIFRQGPSRRGLECQTPSPSWVCGASRGAARPVTGALAGPLLSGAPLSGAPLPR